MLNLYSFLKPILPYLPVKVKLPETKLATEDRGFLRPFNALVSMVILHKIITHLITEHGPPYVYYKFMDPSADGTKVSNCSTNKY